MNTLRPTWREPLADGAKSASVAGRLRSKRFAELLRRFPDLEQMRVLDLGGTEAFWAAAPVRPAALVLLNLEVPASLPRGDGNGPEVVVGDACDPPAEIRLRKFDLVVSNSVIEHVGGHARRKQFAETVAGLAPHHWIQTPYRYFPVEPHWVFPGMQFLPIGAQVAVVSNWPLSPAHPTGRNAVEAALSVELLTKAQMRFYFPDSTLIHERFAGATKSLIAVA